MGKARPAQKESRPPTPHDETIREGSKPKYSQAECCSCRNRPPGGYWERLPGGFFSVRSMDAPAFRSGLPGLW
jgi:hypothetical protein